MTNCSTKNKNRRVNVTDDDRRASKRHCRLLAEPEKYPKGFGGRTRTDGRANDNVVCSPNPKNIRKGSVVGRGQTGEQTTLSFARRTRKISERVRWSDEDRRAQLTTLSFARRTRKKIQKGLSGRDERHDGRANDIVVCSPNPKNNRKGSMVGRGQTGEQTTMSFARRTRKISERVWWSDEDRRASKRHCRLLAEPEK